MKRLLTCLLLAAAPVANARALEVPLDTAVQKLNGSQQSIKTYTLPPPGIATSGHVDTTGGRRRGTGGGNSLIKGL